MTPFLIEYKRRTDKAGVKLSPAAEMLAQMCGDYFQGFANRMEVVERKAKAIHQAEEA